MDEVDALAIVATNLRSRKHNADLVTIGNALRTVVAAHGLEGAATSAGLRSPDMVRKFLRVFDLAPSVRKLVRTRKIDRVTDVEFLARIKNRRHQLELAKILIDSKLPAHQLRDAVRLVQSNPKMSIAQALRKVAKSVPHREKQYLVVMPLPAGRGHYEQVVAKLQRRLRARTISRKGDALLVHLDAADYRRARARARREGVSISDLAETLLREG